MRLRALCASVGTILLLLAAAPASAQQTREEEEAAAQAAKVPTLHPYVPDKAEVVIGKVSTFLLNPPMLLPYVGSIYPGGSTAFGAIFRTKYGDNGVVTSRALWSLRNYKLLDGNVKLPDRVRGRLTTSVNASWLDAPDVSFWGLGPDTVEDDKSGYALEAKTFGARGRLAVFPHLGVGVGLDYLIIGAGPVGDEPVGRVLAPVHIDRDIDYVAPVASVDYDWREGPGYTSTGGLYRLDWSRYFASDSKPFNFDRLDAEVDQFIPIRRGAQVIALRALTTFTDPDVGEVVPYFMLPSLGGSSLLRGYPSWRFRDRYRIAWTGEFRWAASRAVDMALFYDAGKVAAHSEDLNFDDLNHSYGGGIRFHVPGATVLRLELAKTRDEGIGFIIAFGPSF